MADELSEFQHSEHGVRVIRVDLEARIGNKSELECQGEIAFHSDHRTCRFLLDPRLRIQGLTLDGQIVRWNRAGPLVQLHSESGDHLLEAAWKGLVPADGGLGIQGNSFDLNLNLLWFPTFVWGSRFDARLKVYLPRGATAIFPSVARIRKGSATMRSVIDLPLVGGGIQGYARGDGTVAYSLVHRDVGQLCRITESVTEWLEEKWGPRPFRPIRTIETWRTRRGAYSREGLIVTPNWSARAERFVSQRLVHEASHQWWGMDALPGKAWFSEDWLSEGLATYGEYLWLREHRSEELARRFVRKVAGEIHGMRGSLSRLSLWSTEGWSLSRYGALLVLVALENKIPDLVTLLRHYRNRHHNSFLTTRSLMRELGESISKNWLEQHLIANRTWPGDLSPSLR